MDLGPEFGAIAALGVASVRRRHSLLLSRSRTLIVGFATRHRGHDGLPLDERCRFRPVLAVEGWLDGPLELELDLLLVLVARSCSMEDSARSGTQKRSPAI